MANILDKLTARARVRVYKPAPGSDDRPTLCGEKLQKDFDEAGNERHFFEIPAHQADYINKAFRKYTVSEPFIPGVDDASAAPLMDKDFACTICGKTGFKSEAGRLAHERTCKGPDA